MNGKQQILAYRDHLKQWEQPPARRAVIDPEPSGEDPRFKHEKDFIKKITYELVVTLCFGV